MVGPVLGQQTPYPRQYDPALLAPVSRAANRAGLGVANDKLPFCGADIWNAYELSWLDAKGLPQVARGRFIFPCTSPNLIESKSLKLYLNSLNQQQFNSEAEVQACLWRDLSKVAGEDVQVLLQPFRGMQELLEAPTGISLDALDADCDCYETDAGLLQLAGTDQPFTSLVDEVLYTDLFRSLCPVTGQPDWATVTVCYQGEQISHEGLLRYLVSYRNHQGFHENCVEQIYCDIMQQCHPQTLSVEANFLRRGGLDINPVRSSEETMDYVLFPRYNRQ
jgi:7-cyano-7-deazaguanine reductase